MLPPGRSISRHAQSLSMPLPNSLPWMESVDAKMIRAHEHIETLGREITEYLSSIDIKMQLMTAPHLPCPWIVFHASDYIPPMRLTTLIGDSVHNMRAALDNLVCSLARTLDRSCSCKGTAFPYRQNEADWNANAQNDLTGVPRPAKKIIKTLQPWVDTTSPLTILNNLSNIDKHRHCNLALAYSRNTVFRVHCNDGRVLEITAQKPLYLGDIQDFTLPIDPSLVVPSARIQASGTLVLTFQEEGPWADSPIMQVLQDCFGHIERKVIGQLRPFFEPPAP
jgi:hypothetical protein